MDESHKVGNSNTSLFKTIQALLDQVPAARLMALSATWASSIEGVRLLAPRLGLCGGDSPFEDFDCFKAGNRSLGASGLELVTAQLSARGQFLSRTLSYDGVEVRNVSASDLPADTAMLALYDECASLWKDILDLGVWSSRKEKGYYCGRSMAFFRSLILFSKLDLVEQQTLKELEAGHQVVITVLSTSEAATQRLIARQKEEETNEGLDLDEDEVVDDANGQSGPFFDGLAMILNRAESLVDEDDARERVAELRARAAALSLPVVGPLDELVHRFGGSVDHVAELTGRSMQQVKEGDEWVVQPRPTRNMEAEKKAFQEGHKKICLLSSVASTGVSLHDEGGLDGTSTKRVMIVFELPFSSTQVIQTLGRVHRSNQLSAPTFILTSSVHEAEKRFSASVSARLSTLGSATAGDARNVGAVSFQGEQLVSAAGGRAAKSLVEQLGLGDDSRMNGRRFLNRMLQLSVGRANSLMTEFMKRTKEQTAIDLQRGKLVSRGAVVEDEKMRVVEERHTPKGETILVWKTDRRLNFEDMIRKRDSIRGTGTGAFLARHRGKLALAHIRPGIASIKLHYPSGVAMNAEAALVNEIKDDVAATCHGEWGNAYISAPLTTLYTAVVPCPFVVSTISSSPRLCRIVRATKDKCLGVLINESVAERVSAA